MHRVRRVTTNEGTATATAAAIDSEMLQLEHHVRMLEDAYQEERHQRELLEKKYARLKRRYIRLERAHAKVVLETHEMHRSDARDRSALPTPLSTTTEFQSVRPESSSSGNVRLALPSRDAYSSPVYATERSPVRLDQRSTLDTDVIDLTSPTSRSTQARARSPDVTFVDALRTARTTARTLSDDFCAESPDSSRGDDDESSRRFVETASAAGRRQLDYGLTDQHHPAPAQLHDMYTTDDGDASLRLRTSNARDASSHAIGRPRPRLGPVDSPDRRIRRGPEQDRDYDLGRRRRRQAVETPAVRYATTSPASSVASSPTTINSSPRSSPGRDNDDEAASLALAQYLQQQENIAAFEEYEARARAAAAERERIAMTSNQHEFDGSHYHYHAAPAAASAMALHGRDIDPDNMTYDELLQLGEENGDVKRERWRQMAVQVISCLPTHRWTGDNTADVSCIICQYSFVNNDRALTLPCAHVFHEECVDSWIRENNSCPLCKLEIVNM